MRNIKQVPEIIPFDDEENFDEPFTTIRSIDENTLIGESQPYLVDDRIRMKVGNKSLELQLDGSVIKFKEIYNGFWC